MSRSDFTRIERRDSGNSGDAGLLSGGALQGSCARPSAAPGLVEHFFRREYGRLVALLARKVGVRHIDVVEDAVQSALLRMLFVCCDGAIPAGSTIGVSFFSSPPQATVPVTTTDRNGNQITETNGVYTDTLGTTALTASGGAPSGMLLTYTAPSGSKS